MPADTSLKRFYDDNGYLVVERLFSREELDPIRKRVDEIISDPSRAPAGIMIAREMDTRKDRDGAAHSSIRNISFMARFDPQFRDLARTAKLLDIVRALIGPRIKLFRDQMLLKPPGGQDKPPHQDQSYFRVNPIDAVVTAWIALDDATIENGCMRYVPGSHRHGLFEVEHDPDRPVHHIPKTPGIVLQDEVACPVPAGSVIFHHGLTLHRSNINHTDTWRRALIFHFATSDSRSQIEKLNEEVSLTID